MNSIFNRGPSLQSRFILAISIALSIIVVDSRLDRFCQIRNYMDTIISPFYFISNSFCELLDSISQIIFLRNQLKFENNILHQTLLLKNTELLMLEHYKKENARLHDLLNSPLRQNEQKMLTRVISSVSDPYNNQVIIDKGSINGVYKGQPVMSNKGIVGQVISVAKLTSRVMLICDTAHALPIQVLRNDVRVIAAGNGCPRDLKLKYLPLNSDIRIGDVLITSGLDGQFPEGYPVAIVSSVNLDLQHGYTRIQARPIASLHHLHYLLLVWKANYTTRTIMTPEEVRHIAYERLIQTKPQQTHYYFHDNVLM